MTRFPRTSLLLALLLAACPVHAVGLPDTGQDTCYNDTTVDSVPASDPASIARDGGTHPRQDCRYGPDATAATGVMPKTGAGVKGFDYTKIANNGAALAADANLGTAATDWACTRDNITGLTWEVKTGSNTDLRYFGHRYSWYNSDGTINGGNAGSTGYNSCNATLPGGLCNTDAYVAAVNAAALCSYTDWRVPTLRELLTLVYAGGSNPSIDQTYFPNTPWSFVFWSGSSYVLDPTYAWSLVFNQPQMYGNAKEDGNGYLRVVRGGQF